MNDTSNRPAEVGGIWIKESSRGVQYLSIGLNIDELMNQIAQAQAEGKDRLFLAAFANEHKQPGERTPDYRMIGNRPQAQAPAPQRQPLQQQRPQVVGVRKAQAMAADLDDSIPF
jgi:hypothetical protein